MRALLFVLLAACRAPSTPPDAGDTTVRVATFNVRRYFDAVCDSGACDSDDYEALPSTASFDERTRQLASAIRGLDADVVALQEVETQTCLDALLGELGDAMPYGVLGEIGGTATVDVAVLSRTPLGDVVGHRATSPLTLADGTTTVFSRELLEVHVRDSALIVFAAHFRSKSNDDPARRLAEAQVARRVVSDVAAAAPASVVVLAGDLNDVPGSPPLDALVGNEGLVRLADDLPVAAQATYSFSGQGQALDHLLVARGRSEQARVPESARVWHDGTRWGWGGSDHAALTAELSLP